VDSDVNLQKKALFAKYAAALLADFNLRPVNYAHPSWLQDGISQFTSDETHQQRTASDWLLKQNGLDQEFDWSMSEPQKRLFLLDSKSLEELAKYISLLMHSRWLKLVVGRAAVQSLEERLGAENVEFAMENTPHSQVEHSLPQADFADPNLTQAMTQDGARTLFMLLEPTWRAVRGRASFKFDKSWEIIKVTSAETVKTKALLALVCQHIIPKRLPQWAWLF
jgi:hypothetical protein